MIGAMRRRVEVLTVSQTAGASGATTRSYATAATVWGRLRAIGGGVAKVGGIVDAAGIEPSHVVTVRAGVAIPGDAWMRVDATRLFRVLAVAPVGDDVSSGGYLDVTLAEERE